MDENQKAFVHTPSPESSIQDEQIVVMEEKTSKTLMKNDRRKFEGLIYGKNPQT